MYSIFVCCILMWWATTTSFSIIYNCVYTLFTRLGSFTNSIVLTVYHPIQAGGTTLYQFFSLGFNLLTLALCLVYYTIALWIFCYVIILLYRFVQRHDFAIQGEFYFSPSLRCNHFGSQGQTLTITPVLLENLDRGYTCLTLFLNLCIELYICSMPPKKQQLKSVLLPLHKLDHDQQKCPR